MITDTDNVRLAAANILLGRGVKYTIPDTPLFWQLFRLNRLHIKPLKAGTLIEISSIIDRYNLNKIEDVGKTYLNLKAIATLIAVSILNGKMKIKFFSSLLTCIILWYIPAKALLSIFYQIVQINNLSDFMNITIYFEHQAQMMMGPKNLGQEIKGS